MIDSAALVAQRLALLPTLLAEVLSACRAQAVETLRTAPQPILITGGGLSEGPGRLLGAMLRAVGVAADFVPLSEFVGEQVPQAGGTLVLFSQGLAPNARFPLVHLRAFRRTLLITSVRLSDPDLSRDLVGWAAWLRAHHAEVLCIPPLDEPGLLLRVLGPAAQALAACTLVDPTSPILDALPACYEPSAANPHATLVRDGMLPPVALVASGRYGEACHGLRWKLLEGLQLPDPPVWDLLQVVHGPLQSFYLRPQTLVVLARADAPHEAALAARVPLVCDQRHHRVLTLSSHLPGFFAYFAQDAQLNWLVLDALVRGGTDLACWPGKDCDGPLYELSPPVPMG